MAAPRKLLPSAMRLLADGQPVHHHPVHHHHDQQGTRSVWSLAFLRAWMAQRTSVFGLHLWVLIVAGAGAAVVLVIVLFSVCFCCRRRRSRKAGLYSHLHQAGAKALKKQVHQPAPPKDIQEVVRRQRPQPPAILEIAKPEQPQKRPPPPHRPAAPVESSTTSGMTATTSGESARAGSAGSCSAGPDASHLAWGQWFTLRELEEATDGLAVENVVGEGGYGVVYKGVLPDSTVVAIKNLINNRGQAEKEFKVEVEAMGRVRHKNLVRLLGCCAEGTSRMLVYEFVDNGNLDRWLHRDGGQVSPLTWDMRMNILLGTAKGLAYLHEGLEPKVVHRDVKSSNILLNRQWNPKVSDFGLAKLLSSEISYVTTRVMGTFGYVAPEYASSGMLNERSDVYSFGVLIMEIITGRTPVDYTRPPTEVSLVDWLKNMVADRRVEEVVDPRLAEKPSSKSLKRALLVALRCVDPDGHKRPTMGHVIHMLEMDGQLFQDDKKLARDISSVPSDRSDDTNEHRDMIGKRKHQRYR